jgi:hypothetical protein
MSGHKRKNQLEDFRITEREANSARRKEIDPKLFYTADLSALPVIDAGDKIAAKVTERASRNMIYFAEPISNIELKMSYGPGQLEIIAQYEENYQAYIKALLDWAEACINKKRITDALRILEHTIELESEYRKSYYLTTDLYAEVNDIGMIDALREKVEARRFKDPQVQQMILKYIDKIAMKVSPA